MRPFVIISCYSTVQIDFYRLLSFLIHSIHFSSCPNEKYKVHASSAVIIPTFSIHVAGAMKTSQSSFVNVSGQVDMRTQAVKVTNRVPAVKLPETAPLKNN
jgi:hypothetical protein